MDGPAETDPRLAGLLARLVDDPRVVGTARLARADRVALVVACTWDGLAGLGEELPALGALLPGIAGAVISADESRWTALTAEGERYEIGLERIADLKPSALGEGAVALHDPRGLMEQWARWSQGRPRTVPDPVHLHAESVLRIDDSLRSVASLPPGSRRLLPGSRRPSSALRPLLGEGLRDMAEGLDRGDPVESALADRIRRWTAGLAQAGAGVVVDRDGPQDDPLERFLGVADGEGFAGDRVLFEAAARALEGAAGRPVCFEQGFCLPTFDAVEGRWAVGEAVGGCEPPLFPCVHVGVGVTPRDDLELWAAPAVRDPSVHTACVADDGDRTVLARTAGREALLATLCDAVLAAYDRLPDLLARARGAYETPVEDPSEALKPLHLPASLRVAALEMNGMCGKGNLLFLALALTRAAEDAQPLVARKLGLAAGRLLRTAPP